jgi:hypothetical protein
MSEEKDPFDTWYEKFYTEPIPRYYSKERVRDAWNYQQSKIEALEKLVDHWRAEALGPFSETKELIDRVGALEKKLDIAIALEQIRELRDE